jgi:uncharacterized repeat protein (TIGR01451 family)
MRTLLLSGVMIAAGLASPAMAGPVKIVADVLGETRVRANDGTTDIKLVPAGRVVPGDNVVYRLTVRNDGAAAARGIVVANPVPAGMEYVGPAAGSAAPELSVDGKTFGTLAALSAGGRPATASDVRVVRWRLAQPVAAGGTSSVAFRARLK